MSVQEIPTATAQSARRQTKATPGMRVLKQLRELPLLPALVVVLILGAVFNSSFFRADNLINVLAQSAVLGVVVIAQTLVLLVKRIDLSVESTVTLAPLVAVWLMVPQATGGLGVGLNPYLAMAVTVLIGVIVGLFNGLLIVKAHLNPFIVTLAMLILLRGLAQGVAQGASLYGIPEPYLFLGAANIAGIPVAVWICGLLFLGVGAFLRYHRAGRALYAIGGNEQAAFAAGIRVNRLVIGTFVAAGVLSALAGLLLAGRLAATTATQGQNLVFSVLAACVIGGISLNGGRGRLVGALTGVLLLGVVQNLLVLSNIASYWIDATYGVIILIALVLARLTGGRDKS